VFTVRRLDEMSPTTIAIAALTHPLHACLIALVVARLVAALVGGAERGTAAGEVGPSPRSTRQAPGGAAIDGRRRERSAPVAA
jgi:hypothetical protein